MISVEKISIFKKYLGDLDGKTLIGSVREQTLVNDDDWHQIQRMIQGLYLVEAGLATRNYRAKLDAELAESCSDAAAVDALKALARQLYNNAPIA